jgi:hypothetical protein
MSRGVGALCAGALLLAAGCTLDSFLVPLGAAAQPRVLVVNGGMEQTETLLFDALFAAHIQPWPPVTRGNERRIAAQSKAGHVFCIHLTRENGSEDKTRVLVQWDRAADEELWQLVVKALTGPDRQRADEE